MRGGRRCEGGLRETATPSDPFAILSPCKAPACSRDPEGEFEMPSVAMDDFGPWKGFESRSRRHGKTTGG